jgi:hypothetical protein
MTTGVEAQDDGAFGGGGAHSIFEAQPTNETHESDDKKRTRRIVTHGATAPERASIAGRDSLDPAADPRDLSAFLRTNGCAANFALAPRLKA